MGNELEGNIQPPQGLPPKGEPTASAFSKFVDGLKAAGASVDRAVIDMMGPIVEPKTQDIVENVRTRESNNELDPETADAVAGMLDEAPESPPGAEGGTPATLIDQGVDAAAVQRRFEEDGVPEDKRTDMRNLNTERHMEGAAADPIKGLEGIDPDQDAQKVADDVAAIFDAVAEEIGDEHVVRHNKTLEDMSIEDVREEMKGYLGKGNRQLATDRQLYAARSILASMGSDVAQIANEIKSGVKTKEILLTYQRKIKQLAALQAHLRGNVKEVARALQQQSVIAKTLQRGSLTDIDELMNVAHMTPEQIARHANVIANSVENNGPVAGLVPTLVQRLNNNIALAAEYWKANLLSGPETHMVNVVGNGLFNIWENAVIRPAAAAVGKGFQYTRWGSDTDRVHIGEATGALAASYAGARDGIAMFARMLTEEKSLFMTGGKGEAHGLMRAAADRIEGEKAGKFARGAAKTLSMPYRFLQAEDDFFKTLAYRQEVTTLALREAYGEGLTGRAAYEAAAEKIKLPSDDMHEKALEFAKNTTFTNTEQTGILGILGKQMKKVTAAYPLLQFVTPFINTPVNLMQRAAEMSVLSIVSPKLWDEVAKGGAARDVAFAKMGTGAVVTYVTYQLYEEGFLTGNGPSNPNQRRVLEKTGWKPNSVRDPATGKYYPYKRLEPFAGAVGGLVNKLEAAKYAATEEDAALLMSIAIFGIAEHALEGTFMTGLNDLLQVSVSKTKSPASYFSSIATGFVPMASLLRATTKMIDPQMRRTTDDREYQTGFLRQMNQKLRKSIPGLSFALRPARYWDGTVATPSQGRVAYSMSPVKMSEDKGATPIDRELIKNGVPTPEPTPMVTVGRGATAIHFSLMDLDNGDGHVYDEYYKMVGKERKILMQELLQDSDYQEMTPGPGGSRNLEMKKALHRAQRTSMYTFLEENLLPMYHKNPEKFNSIALMVGVDMEDFHERINNILAAKASGAKLPGDLEEMTTHVRRGRGQREKALPVPTDKVYKEERKYTPEF